MTGTIMNLDKKKAYFVLNVVLQAENMAMWQSLSVMSDNLNVPEVTW
jgi:hypothetical protein